MSTKTPDDQLHQLIESLPPGTAISIRSGEKADSRYRVTNRSIECSSGNCLFQTLQEGYVVALQLHEARQAALAEKERKRALAQEEKRRKALNL